MIKLQLLFVHRLYLKKISQLFLYQVYPIYLQFIVMKMDIIQFIRVIDMVLETQMMNGMQKKSNIFLLEILSPKVLV